MPPNEEILEVQSEVFADEITKERPDDPLRWVSTNGAFFRQFTEQLSPEVRAIWDRYAHGDRSALDALEDSYDAFKKELTEEIADYDPEASDALALAMEHGDMETASRIIESHAKQKRDAE